MSDVLCDTKYLQLKKAQFKNGVSWVYAHRPNADNVVVILPVTNEGEILFLIEERPPLQAEGRGKYCIGLPAGLVGDERRGESTEDAIRAELREEAGLVAESIKIVAKRVSTSSGCVSETCTLAIARIKTTFAEFTPVDDGGVIVDRIWVKHADVNKWLKQKDDEGYVVSGQTLACLYYLENEI